MEGVSICNNSDLPPGFRFHPTDQELIVHYLRKKVSSSSQTPVVSIIADVDLYKFNPWELPGKALFGENEWFFFSPRDRKYPNGARPNRSAASGYWKATGTDKPILAAGGTLCLGVKKALVFYGGRPPKGIKTDWVMHEYRLLGNPPTSQKLKGSMRLDDWVLCRVRQKGCLPLQVGDKHNESPEASHSFDDGYLGKLFLLNKNDFIQDTDYQALGQLFGSPEDIKGPFRNVVPTFQRTPEASNSNNMFLQSLGTQFFCSSSNNQILDSPKRSFSIGSGGELEDYMQLLPPPSKRLSTINNGDTVTDASSPSYSTTLHSCFSEYIA